MGGLALGLVLLAALGGGAWRRDTLSYVMFFEGSVNGLRVGAPVTFRGVKVGSVKDILLEVSEEREEILIPVYIELEHRRVILREGDLAVGSRQSPSQFIDLLVQRGLRGQLQMQSVLTGQLMIQLDLFPNSQPRLLGTAKGVAELPTVPSPLTVIARRIESLPLEEIVRQIASITGGLDKIVNSEETRKTLEELTAVMVDLRELLVMVQEGFPALGARLDQTMGTASQFLATADDSLKELTPPLKLAVVQIERTAALDTGRPAELVDLFGQTAVAAMATLGRIDQAVAALEREVAGDTAIRWQLRSALEELAAAARAVRSASAFLERHPETLLRGKGKDPSR